MKALKIILFVIAVLILLFVILGFIGPKSYNVSRSLEINAPVEMVYEQVSDLSKMIDWDPWKDEFPDMKITINGPGDEVGSYRRWESEKSVGEQLLVAMVTNESVDTELKFIKPFEMKSNGHFQLEPSGEGGSGTKLTQSFNGENSFMGRAMSMLPGMSMDANVGPMFVKGLQNIKGIVEAQAKEQSESISKMKNSKYSFGIQETPAKTFVLKRATVQFSEMTAFYTDNLTSIYTAVAASGEEITGKPCGIFYSYDKEKGEADMCAAIPVSNKSVKIQGYETITIPAGRAVKLPYTGSYDGIGEAHYAMDDYLKAYNLVQVGPVVEEYVTDPKTEPDPRKWLTNIYYHIK